MPPTPAPASAPASASETETDPESETDPASASASASASETETDPESETDTESETESETDPESDPESESDSSPSLSRSGGARGGGEAPAREGGSLARAVYALALTRRRRWLWCAWWTAEPTEQPFRPPDAWGGGARTEDEARALAEAAAGRPLTRVDGAWAGAWQRQRAGLPPFPRFRERAAARPDRAALPRAVDPHAVLGVVPGADADAIRAAFRERAHQHHPDRGGSAEAFIALRRAYDTLLGRRPRRPRPRPRES